jgi:hypothetical protein
MEGAMPVDWLLLTKVPSFVWTAIGKVSGAARTKLRRPRLKIYFDTSKAYKKAMIEATGQWGCFCHLVVHNSGLETAQDCAVWLDRVSVITQEGEKLEQDFVAPRQLQWAYEQEGYKPHVIEPGTPRLVDLCYTVAGDPSVHFFFSSETVGVKRSYPSGIYRAYVQVKSTNADRTEAAFDICFSDGQWDRITILPPYTTGRPPMNAYIPPA